MLASAEKGVAAGAHRRVGFERSRGDSQYLPSSALLDADPPPSSRGVTHALLLLPRRCHRRRSQSPPAHFLESRGGRARGSSTLLSAIFSSIDLSRHLLPRVVRACCAWGIPALTVFAMSKDNSSARPAAETRALLALVEASLGSVDVAWLQRERVTLRFVGDRVGLPPSVRRAVEQAERDTVPEPTDAVDGPSDGPALRLTVALLYSARADLARAARRLARSVARGDLDVDDVDEGALASELSTSAVFPQDVDLVVRSGGERRLSDFLLWESQYAELCFVDARWPDFGPAELETALRD